ncbi:GxxExxY protein [Chryseobacterium gotjawalense]|uniref:GxxExxY protein n=1 Tax=Chryseobacterium gotjawalense TaxID=3042315 RepID=A0ABY8RAG7_9FLAO|nr:GxxExxY protein [Chryseobacterium sp. wdc7]WHF50950.1 GxxExxY protein [Chryseobacterium sp. wdc7]
MSVTKKQVTQLSYDITGFAIKVHKNLGPGLLERIYETCLKFELERNGYSVKQQVTANIVYDGLLMETTLKLDLLVNDLVIVELKTVEELKPVHQAQLLTYMKLLEKPQGLLFNFFTDKITKSMKPVVNEYFTSLPD